jgi:predicted Zn finger-like uncharacterized protein
MTCQRAISTSALLLFLHGLLNASNVLAFTVIPILSKSQSVVVVDRERSFRTKLSSDVSKQSAYGVSEELPDSYVRCSKCQTVYAITEADLDVGDRGGGRRLDCSVCSHSWYQSKDRLMTVQEDFVLDPLPERDLMRIKRNMEEGKSPKFLGDKKLYVGNISFECHEDDLYKIFSSCGEVGDVSFVRDETGRNRGFGFVTMRTDADGLKAVEQLDGMSVRGRNIAVRESNN